MKRKLDAKRLVLESNTVTVLTQQQFELIAGGRRGDDIDRLAAKRTLNRC